MKGFESELGHGFPIQLKLSVGPMFPQGQPNYFIEIGFVVDRSSKLYYLTFYIR